MPLNAVPDAAPDPAGDPAGAPHPLLGWLTPARRMWLYGLTLAGLPLLSYYGVVTETVAPIWAGFVLAFLSAGTAITHVSK